MRWEEIVEHCLSCIIYFGKDGINRTIIRDRVILQTLKTLLGHNSESIQRLSLGVLNEISGDLDGAFAIQHEGLEGPVQSLINSRNEKIGESWIRSTERFPVGDTISFKWIIYPMAVCDFFLY